MRNILLSVLGLGIWCGLIVFFSRLRAQRPREEAALGSLTVRVLVILFVGAAALFLGVRQYRRSQERRHPAVDEHRDELLEAAAKALGCSSERVAVQVQEPTLAGVTGCGRSLTFRWGAVLNRTSARRSTTPIWHEIDPNCRADYMGCSMPCE